MCLVAASHLVAHGPSIALRVGVSRDDDDVWIRLRQVALVARQLDPVARQLEGALGLGPPFHDPGVREFGLENSVWPVGRTFLEVVSPVVAGTTAGRYLERRAGDGGYMVILQCADVDAMRIRATERGIPIVWKLDLPDIRGTHLHPRFTGGAILSLDETVEADAWRWGGPDWPHRVRREIATGIVGVDIQADEPGEVARRWADLLDKPLTMAGDGSAYAIALDEGMLRFVALADQRGEGLRAIDVVAGDHAQARIGSSITVCGCEIRFVGN
jgi:hypothetical protein